ncbi:ribonuclease H-like protein [Auricularia subglabra TFB-10046 SS5]|nr:ribonuclease H-like protein [Auricularia subglabra TFB-10046 SS5]
MAPTTPLRLEDGPLIWVDCEMTGLEPKTDVLLEIAVIITNGQLTPVDDGISYVIQTPKRVLDNMNEWCINQHGKSGLTQACLNSPHTHSWVQDTVLTYIKRWVPDERTGVLAGNSVHADRMFLAEHMRPIVDHLHYRIVDVSTIKELTKRWYPNKAEGRLSRVAKESSHRALDDILGSIEELRWYRENVFLPSE